MRLQTHWVWTLPCVTRLKTSWSSSASRTRSSRLHSSTSSSHTPNPSSSSTPTRQCKGNLVKLRRQRGNPPSKTFKCNIRQSSVWRIPSPDFSSNTETALATVQSSTPTALPTPPSCSPVRKQSALQVFHSREHPHSLMNSAKTSRPNLCS